MSAEAPRLEPPLRDLLPLGAASRLLGVDPDTMRRWADQGRIPVFTTPGGHRRFDRAALERLTAGRRTGRAIGLAGLGETANGLADTLRRHYRESHGGEPHPRDRVRRSEHASYRRTGRGLVVAIVRFLDGAGPARDAAERDALALASGLGERLARDGMPLEDGVALLVTASRPLIAEVGALSRRGVVDAASVGDLYEAVTGLLGRLLLAFVAGFGAGGRTTDRAPSPGQAAPPPGH